MSQSDFGTLSSPLPPADFFNDKLHNWRNALHSLHSGSSRPSYVVAGMLWLDTTTTTPALLNFYDGADDILLAKFNYSTNVMSSPDGSVDFGCFTATAFSGLTSLTAVDTADILPIKDVSAGTNKSATVNELFKAVNSFTAMTDVDTADNIHVYDTSGSASKKATLQEVFEVINTFTEDTSPDTSNDFVLSYDANAATVKKVKMSNVASSSGGSPTLIQSTTPTPNTVAVVDFTSIPQTYSKLILICKNAKNVTTTRALNIQLGKAGTIGGVNEGSVYRSVYGGKNITSSNSVQTLNSTTTAIPAGTQTNSQFAHAIVIIDGYRNNVPCTYEAHYITGLASSAWDFSTAHALAFGTVYNDLTTPSIGGAMDTIRVLWDNTGNFNDGTFELWGIA